MAASKRSFLVVALLLAVAVPVAGGAAELRTLVAQYREAKSKLGRTPQKQQGALIRSEMQPKLIEIAKLGDTAGVRFIEGEYRTARGELAEACARALLETSHDQAAALVVAGLSRQQPATKKAILGVLAATSSDLSSAERPLIDLLRVERSADVRKELPAVIAKLDTLTAAKALVLAIRPGGGQRTESDEFSSAVVAALRKTQNDEVKRWLAGDAFAKAPPERFVALARLAGEIKLDDARVKLVEAIDHADEEVALASIEALEKLGLAGAVDRIAELFRESRRLSVGLRIQILDALAASGDEKALDIVLDAARTGDVPTRAIATGSLTRQPKSVKAFEGILRGLEDEAYEVRNAAIRSLGLFRSKAMIAPLIKVIRTEREEKLKIDALQVLIRLTGKNMGLQSEDWQKWWEVAADSFELPKPDDKGFTTVKAYDLEYFGLEVNSGRVAFLVDASSSMLQTVPVKRRLDDGDGDEGERRRGRTGVRKPSGGDGGEKKGGGKATGKARKIDVLKSELVRVIKRLPATTSINIIFFHSNYNSWKKQLHPLSGRGRAEAVSFVRGLNNGTGTNVFDTLEFALRDKRVDTIFLLTDGMPTRGRITDAAGILREIRKLNRVRGATINCIAFGEESTLLKDLARENGGAYRFVDEY